MRLAWQEVAANLVFLFASLCAYLFIELTGTSEASR